MTENKRGILGELERFDNPSLLSPHPPFEINLLIAIEYIVFWY